MVVNNIKRALQEILDFANVKINGNRPWDIQVHNNNFYSRVLTGGSLALGESYMDKWWDCKAVDELIYRILKAGLDKKVKGSKNLFWLFLKAKLTNRQAKSRAFIVGEKHYDIGNDLYKYMLDKRMNYSCAYWKNSKTLYKAQEAKLDLICQKLKLKPGMTVLDIGCGWGSFAKFAAEKYKVKVLGITISKEQVKLARKFCKGFDVEIRLQDYRNLKHKFDRVVSIGMFEHVGCKNYNKFFKIVNSCLKTNGLFLLHTIGTSISTISTEPWTDKYIFPNGMLPSAVQITKTYEGIFQLDDWHSFGVYYNPTLMAWYNNFNNNWSKLKNNYDKRFFRMWSYYLLSSAGSFRARHNHVWQIVLSKPGSQLKYQSVR